MGMDREWEKRVLCSDESCIGTIGSDGRCRECGLAYKGQLPEGFQDTRADEDSGVADIQPEGDTQYLLDETDEPARDEDEDEDVSADSDDEWARRILCNDGNCIGVINEKTGRCKECGKPIHDE